MNVHDDLVQVEATVARARAAQKAYEAGASQERYDRAAQAVAWAEEVPPKRDQSHFSGNERTSEKAWALNKLTRG